MELSQRQNKKVIIYDGHCLMCSWWARRIYKIDRKHVFSMISSHSTQAATLGFKELDTIVFLDEGMASFKSRALLNIASYLGFPYSLFLLVGWLPQKRLDAMYDFVARNRFKWFKSHRVCSMDIGQR